MKNRKIKLESFSLIFILSIPSPLSLPSSLLTVANKTLTLHYNQHTNEERTNGKNVKDRQQETRKCVRGGAMREPTALRASESAGRRRKETLSGA